MKDVSRRAAPPARRFWLPGLFILALALAVAGSAGRTVVASFLVNRAGLLMARAVLGPGATAQDSWQQAGRYAAQAVALAPDFGRGYLAQGRAALATRGPAAASEPLSRAAALDPGDEIAVLAAGAALDGAGDHTAAVAQWVGGERSSLYFLRRAGMAYDKEQFAAAQADYETAAAIAHTQGYADEEARSLRGIGDALVGQGNDRAAVTYYERAVTLAPQDYQLRAVLAHSLLMVKEYDRARAEATRSAGQASNWLAHLVLGQLLLRDNRLEPALEQFQLAAQQKIGDPWPRYYIATVRARQGDSQQARTLFAQILETTPDFEPARQALGKLESK